MTYRDDLIALAAHHAALEAEVREKTVQRDAASRLLAEARARVTLPVLPNIEVASPCRADWNQMKGDERVRACGRCNQRVYNLSEMTREEAEALILAREGRLCVRYYQRADGTILTRDCAIGVQRRRRRLFATGVAAGLAAGAALAFVPARVREAPHVEERWIVQGKLTEPDRSYIPTIIVTDHEITYQGQLVHSFDLVDDSDSKFKYDALYERLDAAAKKIFEGFRPREPRELPFDRFVFLQVDGKVGMDVIHRIVNSAKAAGYDVVLVP